jgi:maltose O-acetyltransferase
MSVPAHIPVEQRYAAADAAHAAQLSGMSQTQRMLAGLPYDPADAALVKARLRVRRIFRQFNLSETPADDAVGMGVERRRLFADLLGIKESDMAQNVFVEPPFWW